MKIAYITAGAGHMYCGSCLRDNTLAAALRDAGHDVLLIPTYTPTRTDERERQPAPRLPGRHQRVPAAAPRVLPPDAAAARPPARLRRRCCGWPRGGASASIRTQLGAMTVSMLHGPDGFQRKEVVTSSSGFLADEAARRSSRIPNSLLIAPRAGHQGRRERADRAARSRARTASSTASVSRIAAKSLAAHSRARRARGRVRRRQPVRRRLRMAAYLGIDRARIHVVPLGIDFDGHAKRTAPDPEPFTIGYLARIAPEKGLHILCEAYRQLASRTRRCRRAGSSRRGYLAPNTGRTSRASRSRWPSGAWPITSSTAANWTATASSPSCTS